MKRILNIVWIIISAALTLNAAEAAELRGRIINGETLNPVMGATIRLPETGQTAPSDKHGEFRFVGLADGIYRLVVTHVAFDQSDTLTVKVDGTAELQVRLTPTPWVLDGVVVTGTRSPHLLKDVPVQTEVVSRRDFARTGSSTVDEALTSAVGINISNDLSGKGATIRGIEGDRVLVLVDGERAVGRVRGSIDLGQFSLTNVEKIEVVKGTGSTLYGSEAMGGVVNIVTRKPRFSGGRAKLYLDYGSHNSYNPSATMEYGNDRFGLTLGGKLSSTDGFDLDESSPQTNGEDQIDRWNFDGKLRARLSDRWSLTTSGRFMSEERRWVEYEEIDALNKYIYDDVEENRRYDGSLSLDYLSGDKYSMKLRLSGTFYDHQWNKFNGPFWVDTSDTEERFYELSYTSNYVIAQQHVATYGFDLNRQDMSSPTLVADKKADQALSGYLQYEYSPIKALNFLPGIRYENHSSFGSHVNPSINIMYRMGDQVKLRGFVGRGFRAPSIKEQYFVFDHTSAGYIVYGGKVDLPSGMQLDDYRELKQENSINSSLSVELSYGTIGMHRLTYFYNHLDDLIEFVLVDFTPTYDRGVYVYQNIERAITQGIEWESRVRLSKSVEFSFSYNYLYSRDLTTQQELVNRPAHSAKFVLSALHKKTGLGASFWGDYHSRKLWVPRSNTGGNEGEPDEYAPSRTTLNLNLFKRFDVGLEAFVRLENILGDTDYRYGYWPGFEVFTGVRYELSMNNLFSDIM